ncbi:STAS domain-containing protein [Pseudomonas sp. 21LCFQ02]|uniref:STAS domain-containing protein n=1 Tax=unclassified Pseudomonas TaxID=196821 RepID=UPI0004F6C9EC|nr:MULTISPECIES: STAS domain-containing protein [unclassified Pseudomonas]MCO8164062.1 STAS domain-containing protein [Pseudomonas sp. 21LCFQ010]MCO8166639.1 STAS domain-containing protein [Pseudomonas sp. 21LCFQ02]MCQ9424274.1 STAS domain-containing protein [Pseudomonas sp. LJDD11]BAP43524.1 STAS domain-containing protein [Pseudomonas sp. StFLB209]
MTESAVRLVGAGELRLVGVLDYSTGPQLRKQGAALIRSSSLPTLVIDCSGVSHSSSVGLALLLGFMRDAQSAGKSVSVHSMPADMRKIAEVSGASALFDNHSPA